MDDSWSLRSSAVVLCIYSEMALSFSPKQLSLPVTSKLVVLLGSKQASVYSYVQVEMLGRRVLLGMDQISTCVSPPLALFFFLPWTRKWLESGQTPCDLAVRFPFKHTMKESNPSLWHSYSVRSAGRGVKNWLPPSTWQVRSYVLCSKIDHPWIGPQCLPDPSLNMGKSLAKNPLVLGPFCESAQTEMFQYSGTGYFPAKGLGICRMHHLLVVSLLWLAVLQIFFHCCFMTSGVCFGWVFANSDATNISGKMENVLDKSCAQYPAASHSIPSSRFAGEPVWLLVVQTSMQVRTATNLRMATLYFTNKNQKKLFCCRVGSRLILTQIYIN